MPKDLPEPDMTFERHMNNLIKESVSEEYDAATYYRQANTMLINAGFDAICLKGECPPLKPWNANEFPELANWLDNNNQILNLIKIGSEQKHYLRFIEEYEESWSLPTENFPDALYKYLLCHLGFTLSNDPGSSKIPEELAISLNLLNQLKSSMTLIRGIMAIAFERDLHLLLQSDLLEQTSTIDIYSTIIDGIDEFNKYKKETIISARIFDLGTRILRMSFYKDAWDFPGMLDTTFWGRMGDIIIWRVSSTFQRFSFNPKIFKPISI